MRVRFDPLATLVVVPATLGGSSGTVLAKLALDTGASRTVIRRRLLAHIGCEPAKGADSVRVTTGSGIETMPRVTIPQVEALGATRYDLLVLCHDLPQTTPVDGVLGLDFFRETRLCIDFRLGEVSID